MRSRFIPASLVAVVLGFSLNFSDSSVQMGLPQAQAAKDSLRSEVAKPMIAAQEFLKTKKYAEALAKIQETDAIANKTPYETFAIEQTRGIAAYSSGQMDVAAKAFEAAIESGKMPAADQPNIMDALTSIYFQAKNYEKVVAWGQRYFSAGGKSPDTKTRMVYSRYLMADYKTAANELNAEIAANEQAGQPPAEQTLQILANCYLKLNDTDGYTRVLGLFVQYYPDPKYWAELITRSQKAAGANNRYSLDFYRLLRATGNVKEAGEYMEMSRKALEVYPAEARTIIEQGFAKGVLGAGPSAAEQKKLREQIAKAAAEDQKLLSKTSGEAKDPDAQVSNGYAFVTMGQFDKGIALIEKAIAKGGLKRPDEATLHLGMAYLEAGDKVSALKHLQAVAGTDGAAQVAKLWILYSKKN